MKTARLKKTKEAGQGLPAATSRASSGGGEVDRGLEKGLLGTKKPTAK
jgi:hypothetical protein